MGRKQAPDSEKDSITQLKEYLKSHYYYRSQKQYQGFWGRLNAWADSGREEEREQLRSQEHYWKPVFFCSGPHGFEEEYKRYLSEHERDNFSVHLLNLIDERGMDPVTVYKNARIDRKLFSKIRTNIDYLPSKRTVIALALSLHLNIEQANRLLRYAGYALSNRILLDVIVMYFIEQGIFDFDEINDALVGHKVKPFL